MGNDYKNKAMILLLGSDYVFLCFNSFHAEICKLKPGFDKQNEASSDLLLNWMAAHRLCTSDFLT